MKIKLEDKSKRKIVYDILNIFFDHQDINFTEDDFDLAIGNGEIIYKGKSHPYADKKDLKANLYEILSALTGYKSPWGTLTGSKPSKLLKAKSLFEIKETYKVSDEKIRLLADVKSEQERLSFDEKAFSLYINIPFCPTRCDYCSYPTLVGPHHDRGAYVEYLIREIEEIKLPGALDSIYIGGGTPSFLRADEIIKMLAAINNKFTYQEFTFEAGREDTLDKAKLELLKAGGVDRISLNPQTFNKNILKSLNRPYDYDHFLNIYKKAKDLGFIINMDFIIGLEGESSKDFAKNFKILGELLPDNITFHALSIKSGSKYKERDIGGERDQALIISKKIEEFTRKFSYKPYYLYRQKNIVSNLENVGYQRNNTSQRYNIIINEEVSNIIGLGMNANSKLKNGNKFRNPRNLRDYYQDFDEILRAKNKMINQYMEDING
ncbi:radical SAM protein [uncultured Anaerococcus sp.]|uniref:radical SAM protein n=1 Tax=uncultured Anaerococcus sp. TaxID=293428 RepID=UPI002608E2ED|nr:radical SAM protein [uncultured Anaerococcus sp.]